MNTVITIKHIYILLFFMLISISACDSSESSLYDNHIIKITTQAQAAPSPFIVEKEAFSAKKQKNINYLMLENHYKLLDFETVKAQTKNAITLSRYLHNIDPYSKYLSKKRYQFVQTRSLLKRVGAGFNLLINKDKILLVPIPNTALYHAGLKNPRYLHSINQQKIHYQDFSSYAFLTQIKSGQKVDISVNDRHSNQNKAYTVKAKSYHRQLDYYSEEKDFYIIRIDEFREGMQKKFRRFLKKINNKKPLIIDLRYCPGGDLFAAVDMLSPLLGQSKTVAYLKKEKSYRPVSLKSIPTKRLFNRNIYLLSSPFTASSAEVFIRGIKHALKKSYIVGAPTQGKCVAQESYTLEDQSALLLSSYTILTPDQKNCDQVAIIPDKSVANIELLSIKQLLKYLPTETP